MMKNTLIVGANRGIGLEISRQLVERGERVWAACRKSSDGLNALARTQDGLKIIEGVDVCAPESLQRLDDRLEGQTLDTLFVVAGILEGMGLKSLDFGSIARQFEVNAMGPLRVCEAMLGHLAEGSKIGLLTSRMGSITDNTSGGQYGYRMSKTALNMAGQSLAGDLKERGISVALLHPGFVRTEMTGGQGLIDADESAAGLIARMDALTLADTGSFWHQNGERLPW